jgi:hypothetical protein
LACDERKLTIRRCADGLVVETTKWEWWNAEEELDRRIKQDDSDQREGG